MAVINFIQIILLLLLGIATLYFFIFALAGLFYRQPAYSANPRMNRIAVLIPGYKEDEVIMEVASDALLQNYPHDLFDVVIIADSFMPETITQLRELPVKLVEVSFDKSTKSKALNKAMEYLPDTYDIAVVLDADNVMARDFLLKVNAAIENGFMVVQGHRTAKNMNNSMAVLDAASEEINNNIFRKGHRVLGFSSALIGSGMAFRYGFFKDLMSTVKAVGGFDKEIELKLLKARHKIEYLDDALVYDEKVQKEEVFSNQRRRWLAAQIIYFRQEFFKALGDLITKGNFDYFDKAMQFIQPPRVLLLGAVVLFTALFSVVNMFIWENSFLLFSWLGLFIACIMVFLFSIPVSFYNLSTLKAMASLPKGMVLMFLSLMRIRGANKQFIHTKHTSTGLEK
jgi:cellulose synthase/poly-beta-1,6-N-acetylglucosamine synthase-like glycosyltransferase